MRYTKMLATLCLLALTLTATGQDVTGDWMSANAEWADGSRLPNNHHARVYNRYLFEKGKAIVFFGNQVNELDYNVKGGVLSIGPALQFKIEECTDKAMTLVTIERESVRYFFVSTDSFTVSGAVRYPMDVINGDTIYQERVGIQPIYKGGDFMQYLVNSLKPLRAAFEFTYVVRKDGAIGDVEIQTSTNPKFNKRLVKVLQKTSGKWRVGKIGGAPVNVKVKSNISISSSYGPRGY